MPLRPLISVVTAWWKASSWLEVKPSPVMAMRKRFPSIPLSTIFEHEAAASIRKALIPKVKILTGKRKLILLHSWHIAIGFLVVNT